MNPPTFTKRRRAFVGGDDFLRRRAPRTLLNGLVAHWRLDEASGTRNDSTGRGNHLADNNTVGQAIGRIGNAAQFVSAQSEYLSIDDNADLSVGAIDFTVAAWAYLDTKVNPMALVAKETADAREYGVVYDEVEERFVFMAGSEALLATSSGAIATATWYFVLAWQDAAAESIRIQVNNGPADSLATAGSFPADGTGQLRIGAGAFGGPGFYFDGRIDSVSIWKRVLTATERTRLYNGGAGVDFPFAV